MYVMLYSDMTALL